MGGGCDDDAGKARSGCCGVVVLWCCDVVLMFCAARGGRAGDLMNCYAAMLWRRGEAMTLISRGGKGGAVVRAALGVVIENTRRPRARASRAS